MSRSSGDALRRWMAVSNTCSNASDGIVNGTEVDKGGPKKLVDTIAGDTHGTFHGPGLVS